MNKTDYLKIIRPGHNPVIDHFKMAHDMYQRITELEESFESNRMTINDLRAKCDVLIREKAGLLKELRSYKHHGAQHVDDRKQQVPKPRVRIFSESQQSEASLRHTNIKGKVTASRSHKDESKEYWFVGSNGGGDWVPSKYVIRTRKVNHE